ncbi:hypothetical protein [Riemerella columbipharyngis]|uniref:Uncharacterized protein n=1 Tax=Riemerella columbipharyngis TaxID=1071918 RepID=A0A1G7A403_9FLAO|nr:hypothetical protein [Riemerella columbipharyngis]SDE08775.1 hypothetical protein SAMN05421544_10316 [Riemerella columbipharyngis]
MENYNDIKTTLINRPIIANQVDLQNIQLLDDNTLSVEGIPIASTENTIHTIQEMGKLTNRQRDLIQKHGGAEEEIAVNNYFNQANGKILGKKILLIGNEESKSIVSAFPVEQEIIPYELSFKLVEEIIAKFDMKIEYIDYNSYGILENGFTIRHDFKRHHRFRRRGVLSVWVLSNCKFGRHYIENPSKKNRLRKPFRRLFLQGSLPHKRTQYQRMG